jgi:pimeloyl-ACP methyl ester carboxylesterase
MSRIYRTLSSLCATTMCALLAVACVDSQPTSTTATDAVWTARVTGGVKPTIVLVHGAWSDGSAWQKVIPLLERDGYRVVAVQNSMRSLSGDVTATRRIIEAQGGPVLLVGHSYGGVIITGAAAGNPNVTGLVYVAAYAPEAGEPFGELAHRFGPSAIDAAIRPDAVGFLYVDYGLFRDVFARDIRESDTRVMAAAQTPLFYSVFGESVTGAAWHNLPSWFVISNNDHVIKPELARFMATRSGARTLAINASHSSPASHPWAVAAVIKAAATAGQR